MTILKGFSLLQCITWSQIFFPVLFFTQVQVKLIKVSCFTSTAIPKRNTPFDWLVFDILFHASSTFEFHHMLVNALIIIICNRITKTLVKMVAKGSDFATFVTFVIFCVARKKEIQNSVFKSQSRHNIFNALVTNELSRFSITFYCR